VRFERENLLFGDDGVKLDVGHFSGDGKRDIIDKNDIVGATSEGDTEIDGG
jgi:hypothetical protein